MHTQNRHLLSLCKETGGFLFTMQSILQARIKTLTKCYINFLSNFYANHKKNPHLCTANS